MTVKIRGGEAFSYAVFDLGPGETVKADGGTMMYMKGDVELERVKVDGATNLLGRVFSGESAFLSLFRGGNSGGSVAFAGVLPGQMTKIDLKGKGANVVLARRAFVCCDENVQISGKANIRGLFEVGQEVGFVLTRAFLPEGVESGRVWVSGFGAEERHDLEPNQSIKINNGMFLASNIPYTIEKAGKSLASSFFSGEGFTMKFVGPGSVHTQSRNFNEFSEIIERRVENNNDSGISMSTGPFKVSWESEGGATDDTRTSTQTHIWPKTALITVLGGLYAAIGALSRP